MQHPTRNFIGILNISFLLFSVPVNAALSSKLNVTPSSLYISPEKSSETRVKMYRNQIIYNKLFVVAILIGIHIAICASDASELASPKNDYVLRSCMSSVELNRRNIVTPGRKLPVVLERPRGRIASLTVTQSPLLRGRVKSAEMKMREKSRRKLVQQRSVTRGRPSRVMIADTPLTTLSLQRKGRNEEPQLFVKKDHLPEVRKSVVNGDSNKHEASIILIQSA